MLIHPGDLEIAFSLGPIPFIDKTLPIRWYGLSYLAGFLVAMWLAKLRSKRSDSPMTSEQVFDFIFYAGLGVVLGGRIGYQLFYNFAGFLDNPLILIKLWEGGMSFHGGLLGVAIATWWFARYKLNVNLFRLGDFVAPIVAPGLFFGRLANFINGELWGRTTSADLPWAVVFSAYDNNPRHPSQLYEAGLEGILLFIVVWVYSMKPRPMGSVCGLFLIGYGCARFFIEFYRQPDAHINFILGDWMTMGHLLSLPMVFAGLIIIFTANKFKEKT